jgi:hypothetical protein
MSEISMAGPLGGADEDPGTPTAYVRDVDGQTLGGAIEDPGASTTYVEDVDGRPLGGPISVRDLGFEDTWCLRSLPLG